MKDILYIALTCELKGIFCEYVIQKKKSSCYLLIVSRRETVPLILLSCLLVFVLIDKLTAKLLVLSFIYNKKRSDFILNWLNHFMHTTTHNFTKLF